MVTTRNIPKDTISMNLSSFPPASHPKNKDDNTSGIKKGKTKSTGSPATNTKSGVKAATVVIPLNLA